MLQTFHWACDNGELGMAEVMLARLAAHAYEVPCLPTGVERRARVTLLGPYERLQNLLLYTGRVRWTTYPWGYRPPPIVRRARSHLSGTAMPKSPIPTLEQARRVGELRSQGLTLEIIGLRFGVSPSAIPACLARLTAVETGGPYGRSDSVPQRQ